MAQDRTSLFRSQSTNFCSCLSLSTLPSPCYSTLTNIKVEMAEEGFSFAEKASTRARSTYFFLFSFFTLWVLPPPDPVPGCRCPPARATTRLGSEASHNLCFVSLNRLWIARPRQRSSRMRLQFQFASTSNDFCRSIKLSSDGDSSNVLCFLYSWSWNFNFWLIWTDKWLALPSVCKR